MQKERSVKKIERYTARTQRLLSEILDRSELLIDLSYSAVIFNSMEIAEDVSEMYEDFEDMEIRLEETILKLSKLVKNPEKLWGILRISHSSREIAEASLMLADLVMRGLPSHELLEPIFEASDETFVKVTVQKDSKTIGRSLGELRLQDRTGMRVICIKRGGGWIYDPNKRTILEYGDILFARGPIEGEQPLFTLSGGKLQGEQG